MKRSGHAPGRLRLWRASGENSTDSGAVGASVPTLQWRSVNARVRSRAGAPAPLLRRRRRRRGGVRGGVAGRGAPGRARGVGAVVREGHKRFDVEDRGAVQQRRPGHADSVRVHACRAGAEGGAVAMKRSSGIRRLRDKGRRAGKEGRAGAARRALYLRAGEADRVGPVRAPRREHPELRPRPARAPVSAAEETRRAPPRRQAPC